MFLSVYCTDNYINERSNAKQCFGATSAAIRATELYLYRVWRPKDMLSCSSDSFEHWWVLKEGASFWLQLQTCHCFPIFKKEMGVKKNQHLILSSLHVWFFCPTLFFLISFFFSVSHSPQSHQMAPGINEKGTWKAHFYRFFFPSLTLTYIHFLDNYSKLNHTYCFLNQDSVLGLSSYPTLN